MSLSSRAARWAEEPDSDLTGFARKGLLTLATVVAVLAAVAWLMATGFYLVTDFFTGLIWLGIPTLLLAFLAFRSPKGTA